MLLHPNPQLSLDKEKTRGVGMGWGAQKGHLSQIPEPQGKNTLIL